MPPQDRFGSHDGGELVKHLAPEDLVFDDEPSAPVVVEQDASFAELLSENPLFRHQVIDGLLLPAIDPTGYDQEQELPWLQNEVQLSPAAGLARKISIGYQ